MIRNRAALATSEACDLALSCVEAGIDAARPRTVVESAVEIRDGDLRVDGTAYSLDGFDEVVVLGAGNAAGQVAAALETVLGDIVDGGVVVTDDPAETERVTVARGDHPVPSERGVAAAESVHRRAEAATERTLVLAVVGGGGSALLPAPAGDLSLDALRAVTDELLASGATIHEINAVRKHLSAVKGGRLAAAAAPATVVGLVFSDVVGNDLDVVASGPLSPDPTTYGDARDVVDRYDLDVPPSVRERLARGVAGDRDETPGPGHPVFDRVDAHVLADGLTALGAAATAAREAGAEPLVLSSRVRGEAREAAKTQVAIAEEAAATGRPVEPPAVLLSGGETTVTLTGDGTGGPNQEFALSAAVELAGGEASVTVASVDTDGVDGATDAAGALIDEGTCDDETAALDALAGNDAYPFLADRDALVETGPTGTNVNDLRVLVVGE